MICGPIAPFCRRAKMLPRMRPAQDLKNGNRTKGVKEVMSREGQPRVRIWLFFSLIVSFVPNKSMKGRSRR